MAALGTIKVCSYNSHGLGAGRKDYIKKLCSLNDFVLLQEHWLLESQLSAFEQDIGDISSHCVSGMDSYNLLSGRPFGGCAVLWKRELSCEVVPIDIQSRRVSAVSITINSSTFLLCSVYMPCNNHSDYEHTYQEVLQDLSTLSENDNYEFIIIGGDFNSSLVTASNKMSRDINSFMENNNLCCVSLHPNFDNITYTFESKANGCQSFIDHFIVSKNLYNSVLFYDVHNEIENPSDHLPVFLELKNNGGLLYEQVSVSHSNDPKVCWSEATPQDINLYKSSLDGNLQSINIPWDAITCKNYFCTEHDTQIQSFYESIVDCCFTASSKAIKVKHSKSRKCIPGWNDMVRDLHHKALFWHTLWKNVGCPNVGTIASIRRSTRAKYHYSIKEAKKVKDNVVANKLAHNMLSSNYSNFWAKVRKLNKKAKKLPCSVNNTVGEENIADLFKEKYSQLLNCVSYSSVKMQNIVSMIKDGIASCCTKGKCYYDHNVDIDAVNKAVRSLKRGKVDGTCYLYSDHLINGSKMLMVYISLMFKAMFSHGVVPRNLLESKIIPIPKNKKKSLSDLNNYRGIALSSIVGKILDKVLISKHSEVLSTCDMQFGFKKRHSTTQCTFNVEEVIKYYNNQCSTVYAMMLDASQAFDRINYVQLFNTLLARGMCPITVRLLVYVYCNQAVMVRWGNSSSSYFSVSNGVKQGGVLSPILFTIYIDNLFTDLNNKGLGCHVGNICAGVFGYADDIILLSPSVHSLNSMYKVCKEFGLKYDIIFNPQKSKVMVFGKDIEGLCIDNNYVKCSQNEKHVGHLIGPQLSNKDITCKSNELMMNTNHIMSVFGNASLEVKYQLFKSFCMPLYGSVLWDYSRSGVDSFFVTWRKCIRRLLNIPYNTHNHLLPLICNDLPVECQLYKRIFKFVLSLSRSENIYNNLSLNLALNGSGSRMCNSLNYLCHKYCLVKSNFTSIRLYAFVKKMRQTCNRSVDNNSVLYANVARDMLFFINAKQFNFFSHNEILDILKFVCTN